MSLPATLTFFIFTPCFLKLTLRDGFVRVVEGGAMDLFIGFFLWVLFALSYCSCYFLTLTGSVVSSRGMGRGGHGVVKFY